MGARDFNKKKYKKIAKKDCKNKNNVVQCKLDTYGLVSIGPEKLIKDVGQ